MDELGRGPSRLLDILAGFLRGDLSTNDAAAEILQVSSLPRDKNFDALVSSAREILHYAEQARQATSSQWAQSFTFELAQSKKDLQKIAKRILGKGK